MSTLMFLAGWQDKYQQYGDRRLWSFFPANWDFSHDMARERTDSKENAAQIMAKSAVPITVPSNVTLSETDIPFITT